MHAKVFKQITQKYQNRNRSPEIPKVTIREAKNKEEIPQTNLTEAPKKAGKKAEKRFTMVIEVEEGRTYVDVLRSTKKGNLLIKIRDFLNKIFENEVAGII